MPVSRRTTLKALGATGGLAALSSTVLATGEYEDDEREPKPKDEYDEYEEALERIPEAAVRVAHFSPDAPDVDVYLDGDLVLSDVTYEEVSPYLEIEPGTYTVTITAAGDPDTVAFEGDVWFGRAFYTVAAIGELGAETFRPIVLVDASAVLVRLVHASPDAPAVDIYVNDGQTPVIENVAFGEATDYVSLPAGTYTVDVRPAGDPETTVFSFDATLERGTVATAYAIGYLEPPADLEDREFDVQVAPDGPLAMLD